MHEVPRTKGKDVARLLLGSCVVADYIIGMTHISVGNIVIDRLSVLLVVRWSWRIRQFPVPVKLVARCQCLACLSPVLTGTREDELYLGQWFVWMGYP